MYLNETIVKSAGAVEYTIYISAKGWAPYAWPGYDSKLSDGKAPASFGATPRLLAGPSGICAGWVNETKSRLGAE